MSELTCLPITPALDGESRRAAKRLFPALTLKTRVLIYLRPGTGEIYKAKILRPKKSYINVEFEIYPRRTWQAPEAPRPAHSREIALRDLPHYAIESESTGLATLREYAAGMAAALARF